MCVSVCAFICLCTNAFVQKVLPRSPCGEVWMWPFQMSVVFKAKPPKFKSHRNVKEWCQRKLWSIFTLYVYKYKWWHGVNIVNTCRNIWIYKCLNAWHGFTTECCVCERVNLCICFCVPVKLSQEGKQAGCVLRWHSKALYVCVYVCVWSRCAWPPCTACCPSVHPSVCRLCPRSANSTTPWQEDPREWDAERWGERWKVSKRQRGGRREGGREGGGGEEVGGAGWKEELRQELEKDYKVEKGLKSGRLKMGVIFDMMLWTLKKRMDWMRKVKGQKVRSWGTHLGAACFAENSWITLSWFWKSF